jgi:hypothetical protein
VAAAAIMLMMLAPTVVAKEPADVSGTWDVAFVDRLRTPAWVAQDILGIVPEGPMTQIICTGSGSMTLTQAGASFSGTYMQNSNQCVTKAGQVFQDPLTFIPFSVLGEINGSSLDLFIDGPAVDCDYRAVIADVDQGVATAISGGGPCLVPGHPKSDVPSGPPPAGTSVTLSFEAWRP